MLKSEMYSGEITYAYNDCRSGILDILLAGTICNPHNYTKSILPDNSYLIGYLQTGRMKITCCDGVRYLTENDLLFLHKNTTCHLSFDSDINCFGYWFVISGKLIDSLAEVYSLANICIRKSYVIDSVITINVILSRTNTDNYHDNMNAVSRYIFDLVLALHDGCEKSQPCSEDHFAQKIKHYIDNNIYNDISLDHIAKHFGLTKMHIIRLFKSAYRVTPMQYAISKRTEIAKALLTDTNISIKKVSEMLHYSNSQHFSNSFRKITGMSPNRFRHMNKPKLKSETNKSE
ncbi:MAG: AraC family transcriptional regulator [Clostridiales bacterium]|nr:AraC family transcriptional regulator [Clostridiales bacterium]